MLKPKLFLITVILSVLALIAGACAQPVPTPTPAPTPGGTLKVYVTDAPPREEVTSIMVTVSEIQVHKAVAEQETDQQQSGTENQTQEQEQQQTQLGEGGWLTIKLSDNVITFDLLKIKGVERFVGTSEVEEGKYTQVRLVIDKVQVQLGSGGALQDATLPSNELKIVHPFDVIEGETTILVIDFEADKMVTVTGANKIIVKPVVKLTVRQEKSGGQKDGEESEEDLEITTTSLSDGDLEITTTSLSDGEVGIAYAVTLEATSGTGSYTWSISEGALPDELELDDDTGVISGNPTAAGDYEFTVQVEDESEPVQSATQEFNISIAAVGEVEITTTSLSDGEVGIAYTVTLEATGGTGSYTWSISEGALPDELELDDDTGVISGNPTAAGDYEFTVQVEDESEPAQSATQEFSIHIEA